MPRMSGVEVAVSAANSGVHTACSPWWASGAAIAGREAKITNADIIRRFEVQWRCPSL